MILKFKNLGPIKEGRIDLTKKFYVFVGYNNSGKTYTSQLLWSIFNSVHKLADKLIVDEIHEVNDISEKLIDTILDRFSTLLENEIVPKDFNIAKEHIITKNLKISFEYNIDDIKKAKIKSNTGFEIEGKRIEAYSISKRKGSLKLTLKENKNIDTNLPNDFYDNYPKKRFTENWKKIKNRIILDTFFNLLFKDPRPELMFLPSDRKSYFTFSPYFFRIEKERREKISSDIYNMVSKQQKNGDVDLEFIVNNNQSDYTAVMDNLLSDYHRLSEEKPEENNFNEKYLESLKKIIGGDIIIQYEDGIPSLRFNIDNNKDKSLKLHLASSSVSQLTALSIYFKYWAAKENNFLLIDEPEENLHPQNQIKLIDLLVNFAAENQNRVLVTTHSPLIANHINNYILFGELKQLKILDEFIAENNGFKKDIFLDKKAIGVYFFDGNRIRDYVEEEMDDTGLFFRDFERERLKIERLTKAIKDKLYDTIEG